MYQHAINEKSILKVNLQVSERKSEKSKQRTTLLEKKYENTKNKNNELMKILEALKAEFVKMQNQQQLDKQAGLMRNPIAGSRVAIKGGGGKRIITPRRLAESTEVDKDEGVVVSIQGGSFK